MKHWEQTLIGADANLREALIVIDRSGAQIALVVDDHVRLLGTLSDGDIRRGLIRGMDLHTPVREALHQRPLTVRLGEPRESVLSLMRKAGIHQVPILDAADRVVGLELIEDFFVPPERDNWVVVMAGGLGTRLKQLTEKTPKPMLRVGGRPLLETILQGFVDQGFRNFYLAVNYKAEVIESYFGDGSSLGMRIRYLRETKRLGTAGALSLLPEPPSAPVVVTNGDLLVKADFAEMVDEHVRSDAAATMAVREYEFQIPYGVISTNDGTIARIEEKPVHRSLVSAGMYVLSRAAVEIVPRDTYYDMPTLFDELIARGLTARSYTVHGYWMDVGRMSDYRRANHEFPEVFE